MTPHRRRSDDPTASSRRFAVEYIGADGDRHEWHGSARTVAAAHAAWRRKVGPRARRLLTREIGPKVR